MDGVAVKPLTVGFHETQFLGKLNQENGFGFWFQLSDEARQQVGSPWGPTNPQALNRYSYVLNNPLKWTDPSGHDSCDFGAGCGGVVQNDTESVYLDCRLGYGSMPRRKWQWGHLRECARGNSSGF